MIKEGEKLAQNTQTLDQIEDTEWSKIISQVQTLFEGKIPDNIELALKELVEIRRKVKEDDSLLKVELNTFGDKYDGLYLNDGLFAKATSIVTDVMTRDSRKFSEASQGGFWGK